MIMINTYHYSHLNTTDTEVKQEGLTNNSWHLGEKDKVVGTNNGKSNHKPSGLTLPGESQC